MKLGFVYAGQGSQKVGMGKEFYEAFPSFKEMLDNAAEYVKSVTDFDLKETCFEDSEGRINQTRYTQPCMVAFAAGITELLRAEGIKPEMVFGLSLGEYSALYAAGVLTFKDVMELVAFRGMAMEEAAAGKDVRMSAVIGTDREIIKECCNKANALLPDKTVQIANYNCPGQVVISGDTEAVMKAEELLTEAGTKTVMPLKVSGPFHTSLMRPAGDMLRDRFSLVTFSSAEIPVIFNATGKTAEEGEKVEELLEKQVQSSVYLEDSIRSAEAAGIDTIIEIGPGKAISKFIKKTAPGIKTYAIDSLKDFQNVIEKMKGEE